MARRRTLDEELRVSDGVTEDDLRAFDIESHTYTAVGLASRHERKGFLIHGVWQCHSFHGRGSGRSREG